MKRGVPGVEEKESKPVCPLRESRKKRRSSGKTNRWGLLTENLFGNLNSKLKGGRMQSCAESVKEDLKKRETLLWVLEGTTSGSRRGERKSTGDTLRGS